MFYKTYTSRKFRNLKRATRSVLVHSIQLSTYLFQRETCNFVYTPSHYRDHQDLFSAKSCLMSFVKPSHAFKLGPAYMEVGDPR